MSWNSHVPPEKPSNLIKASNFIPTTTKGNIKDFYKVGKVLSTDSFGEMRQVKRKDNPEEW